VPAGSVVEPGGVFVIDQQTTTHPEGFDFGLGNADKVRLYLADGVTLMATESWTEHAPVTYARCPNGTGPLEPSFASSKGELNDCSTPLRINEVESSDGDNSDWIELINV